MIEKAYIRLRQVLGGLGIALPVLVILFGLLGQNGPEWYYSISATYYANSGPLFIAVMGAVGLFLITYRGYSRLDFVINLASGVFALLIAFFPCGATSDEYVGLLHLPRDISQLVHNISACVFFILLACNILFLFTKGTGEPTKQKLARNRLYRICGVGIAIFIAFQIATSLLKLPGPYTMINETVMLLCFGVAWLVKGETLLKDKTGVAG